MAGFVKNFLSTPCSSIEIKPIVIIFRTEMIMSTPSTLFNQLLLVIPNIRTVNEYVKLKADGFMDLNVDILYRAGDTARIAIAHNYIQNGVDGYQNPHIVGES